MLLVALFAAPIQLLLFGMIDIAGAAWTAQALRKAVSLGSPAPARNKTS